MDRKAIVLDYLRKCNAYAEKSIARKQNRGETEQTSSWESYIEFNNHAIEEIQNGTLNSWFSPMPTSNMEHAANIQYGTCGATGC